MHMKFFIGDRFGSLIVQAQSANATNGDRCWVCLCDCGKTKIVRSGNLERAKSCGCKNSELIANAKRTHGHSVSGKVTAAYRVWRNMLNRCSNEKVPNFHRYGGRGISVCEAWRVDFSNFLRDMGEPGNGMTIDRINNDGNYELSNCRWVGRKEQAQNRSTSKLTEEIRLKIVSLSNSGMLPQHIAKVVAVNPSTIARFLKGKTYRNKPYWNVPF